MGMSTHVTGYKKADEKWNKYKAIYNAYKDAGMEIPDEINDFFDFEDPAEKPGMDVKLSEDCCYEVTGTGWEGIEINLSKIPEGTTHIRFINSW